MYIYIEAMHREQKYSCMLSVVYSSIQKFTIILIMKSIIFISIINKYLDISIYQQKCNKLAL